MDNLRKNTIDKKKKFYEFDESFFKNDNEFFDYDSKKFFNNSLSLSGSQNYFSQMQNSNFSNYQQELLLNKQIFDSKNNNLSFSKRFELSNSNNQNKIIMKKINSNFQNPNLLIEKKYNQFLYLVKN